MGGDRSGPEGHLRISNGCRVLAGELLGLKPSRGPQSLRLAIPLPGKAGIPPDAPLACLPGAASLGMEAHGCNLPGMAARLTSRRAWVSRQAWIWKPCLVGPLTAEIHGASELKHEESMARKDQKGA